LNDLDLRIVNLFVHALQLLRTHGMTNVSLHIVYRAVALAKLTYAASAWWDYTTAADRQRSEAVLQRAKRTGLCYDDIPTLAKLINDADDELSDKLLGNPYHVLSNILPNETVSSYSLRRSKAPS